MNTIMLTLSMVAGRTATHHIRSQADRRKANLRNLSARGLVEDKFLTWNPDFVQTKVELRAIDG